MAWNNQPKTLGELLDVLASRVKKVDLRIIDEIRTLWPTVVDEALATRCVPELVKNGTLLVSVPSGAFSQRILQEHDDILTGLAVLGDRAPRRIRPYIPET
jgi:hypothetical protein